MLRIEIHTKVEDTRAKVRKKYLQERGFVTIKNIRIHDIYTLDKVFSPKDIKKITATLYNPVTQEIVTKNSRTFRWAVELGFLPGVTDNVGNTTQEIIEDLLNVTFSDTEKVYTSQITYIEGKTSDEEIKKITSSLYNPIIQRAHIKSFSTYKKDGGMNFIIPKVQFLEKAHSSEVSLNVSDKEVERIGRIGIANSDGTRRGPLALNLASMKAIQKYFNELGRNPTDIELESLAQTWSEHCKHTIFTSSIDNLPDGLFQTFIKKATEEIRRKKLSSGRSASGGDFCVSVFTDNSGAITFDEKYLVTHKVETHNSPSALDPFGGSITGIVGVNRDTIGFGLGAKPVANVYGFCLADPQKDVPLYRDGKLQQKMLSSRRIMDGIIEGVNAGGNQSGIPTPQGFLSFDERFAGKPLVFVGTVGLIPKKIKGKPSYVKHALPGDYIVMAGGRVGKDGIHGATFSSETLHSTSPISAVQIGDPITQKKLSDAIVKEARDANLYHSITDNGAGGLSCSVCEMAKESGGCRVYLDKVPVKYEGMSPWEIWISESQERMTLAVAKKNWKRFKSLMFKRSVEATVIGEFANSGRCEIFYKDSKIMNIDLQFLHEGLPKKKLQSRSILSKNKEPKLPSVDHYTHTLLTMIARLNIASFSFISNQYDYIVQGNSVRGPLVGRGRVNSDTSIIRPLLSSNKGIALSQGIYPSYSDIDTYHMAASCIDTAIRNVIAAGADPDYSALLDNFCWCSSTDPGRLGQLKRAAKACYDYAFAFETPFISGKDSMFNDFTGFDKNGKKVMISIPPTLLISSMGVVENVEDSVSLDAKMPGDLVYILGETYDELGASEYFCLLSENLGKEYIGTKVPHVNASHNKKLYKTLYTCIQKELVSSSISVGRGGLAVALAKKAMGGLRGLKIDLHSLPGKSSRDDFALFSESQGRILVSIAPENKKNFETTMKNIPFLAIGTVTDTNTFEISGLTGTSIVKTTIGTLLERYRKTFANF